MDIALLAQTLAAALAPALRSLLAGDLSGVPGTTRHLWKLLQPQVEARPAALAAAETLGRKPEDGRARKALADRLVEILEADFRLAGELAEILYADRPRGSTRSRPDRRGGIFEVTRERAAEDFDSPSPHPPTLGLPSPVGEPESAVDVRFTTYTPAAVRPETWATLLAYCHLPSAAEAVEKDRKGRLGGSPSRSEGASLQAIARGTEITVVPEVTGARFNPPRASFLWLEDWYRAEFRFQATPLSSGAPEARLSGWVSFYVGPVLVGETPIGFRVSPQADSGEAKPAEPSTASPYQAIFVSYSHLDTVIVEQLERAYKALGNSYLRDVEMLRSGQEWNPALLEKIDEADIFQLCWSKSAGASRYVKQEWQHALARGKPSFIRPLYWEKPMPEPPPELAAIHFSYYEVGR
jgi:hypothetical protein